MLCGGGNNYILKSLRVQLASELNNIFHVKGLIRFTFYDVKLIDDRRKNLTWKKM